MSDDDERDEPGAVSVSRRASTAEYWFQRGRAQKILKALRSPRLQEGTLDDFTDQWLADGITRWVRRAVYGPLVPAVGVILYFVGQRALASGVDLDASLRNVLAAASLTSGLLAAGLINATSQTKELRRRRVDELRRCQEELQPIQRVFDALVMGLQNNPEPTFDATSSKQRADAGWEVGKSLRRFLGNIRSVAKGWYGHGEYYGGGKLITFEQISEIEQALADMSGVLWRRKYFMYLVEDLTGTPAGQVWDVDGVRLTQWGGVKYALERIRPQVDDSWQLLSFWEDFINDTHELAVRTRGLATEIYFHNPAQLRLMFVHLTWLTVVGVAVPLTATTFPTLQSHKPGLLLVAVGELLLILASTLLMLFRWIMERRLDDEGRLET